jgi:hypothetical protein
VQGVFGDSEKRHAQHLTARGAELLHTDPAGAEACYWDAIRLDPELYPAWFDLGLIYKWSRRWLESFDCNLQAAELVGERPEEPAWWNLGIAATALHRWDVARRAWRAYGVVLPDGDGPIEADLGYTPVRINPDAGAEVVWGHRIDPARVRLTSIPFPESGHRWADVVLHDGEPRGSREFEGAQRPVFNELVRWAPSDMPTIVMTISSDGPDGAQQIDDLVGLINRAGHMIEDWSRNTRLLCAHCSESDVPHDHVGVTVPEDGSFRRLGVAGPAEVVRELVDDWEFWPTRRCESFEVHD